MKINKIMSYLAVFSLILSFPSVALCADSPTDSQVTTQQETSSSLTNNLNEQELTAINSLAKHCGIVSSEDLKSILSFSASNTSCSLIPIYNCPEHKNCFVKIFSESNPEYMKYYLNGKLMSVRSAESWFDRSVSNINRDKPTSITFLIKYANDIVGRIGIGPLKGTPEIGYALKEEYSGKKIMTNAVGAALEFLQHLKDFGSDVYKFTRLRATAKTGNIASNSVLKTCGFALKRSRINDGYGPQNEYFYYFR